MINILIIHQSAELYGSDKTLLILLSKLDRKKFNPIVILPFDGPLKKELEANNIEVVIAPVLKLYRKMFSIKNISAFRKEFKTAIKMLDVLHKKHHFDLIYSNTLAVLLGIIYAQKRKIKHIWHVHEIIESPSVFTKAFKQFLSLKANTSIVYNSIATQQFWNSKTHLDTKSAVIWNGLEAPENRIDSDLKAKIRNDYFQAQGKDVVIALVGRISRWKGQMVLLNAFKILSQKHENIRLAFIGSPPPNQDVFLENLTDKIRQYDLKEKAVIIPFQENIYDFWQSVDIAVVPSAEPEPFGLVAVEAMLAQKPVIASNHGGLTEIVIHKETGFLVTPNDKKALADALNKLLENEKLRETFAKNGYQRATKYFSANNYVRSFENLFEKMVNN